MSSVIVTETHRARFELPLACRTREYMRVSGCNVWRSQKLVDDPLRIEPILTDCSRYAHDIAHAFIKSIFAGTVVETGFSTDGRGWYFVLDMQQLRWTIEHIAKIADNIVIHFGQHRDIYQVKSLVESEMRWRLPPDVLELMDE